MSVRIISNDEGQAVMYDSTSGFAFGPVFEDYDDPDSFMEWLRSGAGIRAGNELSRRPLIGDGTDPREWEADELGKLVREWKEQEAAQEHESEHPPEIVVGVYEGGRLHVEPDVDMYDPLRAREEGR